MVILCILLLWSGLGPVSGKYANRSIDVIDASAEELMEGYLQWQQQHAMSAPPAKPLKLDMPAIDLYSPAGVSIFYGADSGANAAFLLSLPESIRTARTSAPRPSLKEAIEMFPQLKAHETTLLADKRYTVFAVTYPDWSRCKEQNEAITKLRERGKRTVIRIIEVRLHK